MPFESEVVKHTEVKKIMGLWGKSAGENVTNWKIYPMQHVHNGTKDLYSTEIQQRFNNDSTEVGRINYDFNMPNH